MKVEKVLTTVVLCGYGDAPYIEDQIKSITSQTVKIHKLTIYDDGLSSSAINVVNDYEKKFPDIVKLVVNDSRKGLIHNFGDAIAEAKGDYIFLSDQDDVWSEHKVEKIIEEFHSDRKPDLVFSDAIITDKDGNIHSCNLWERIGFKPRKDKDPEFLFENLLMRQVITGATIAIRREALNYIVPIPDLSPTFLHDGWVGMACAAKGRVSWVNEGLIFYRQHDSQLAGISRSGIELLIHKVRMYTSVNAQTRKNIHEEAEIWKKMLLLLLERIDLSSHKVDLIERKIDFLKYRALKMKKVKRIHSSILHWRNGNYRKFHIRPVRALLLDILMPE